MTSNYVIETHELSKSYGRVEAVRGVSLSVKAHHITAFLGLNGAGKSTLLSLVAGLSRPDAGSIAVNAPAADGAPIKRAP